MKFIIYYSVFVFMLFYQVLETKNDTVKSFHNAYFADVNCAI